MKIVTTKNIVSCPNCKNTNLELLKYHDTVNFRGLDFDVDNLEMSKCTNCGNSWETREQIKNNQQVVKSTYAEHRDKLRKEQGLLSGEEIAKIRSSFQLNQREASLIFGGGFNAFNKYESGEVLQSVAMDRLLKLTYVLKEQGLKTLCAISTNKHSDLNSLEKLFPLHIESTHHWYNFKLPPPIAANSIIQGFQVIEKNNLGLSLTLDTINSSNELKTPYTKVSL